MEYLIIAGVFVGCLILGFLFGGSSDSEYDQAPHEKDSSYDPYKWERQDKDFTVKSWDIRYNDEFLD